VNTDGAVLPLVELSARGRTRWRGRVAFGRAAARRWGGEALSSLPALETGALTGLTVKYLMLVIACKLKSLILLFPWK